MAIQVLKNRLYLKSGPTSGSALHSKNKFQSFVWLSPIILKKKQSNLDLLSLVLYEIEHFKDKVVHFINSMRCSNLSFYSCHNT
jgi:hypothetical protein